MESIQGLGVIIFDILLVVIAAVLIPIGVKVVNVLSSLLSIGNKSIESLEIITNTQKEIVDELIDVKIRDTHMRHEIEALKTALNSKCDK